MIRITALDFIQEENLHMIESLTHLDAHIVGLSTFWAMMLSIAIYLVAGSLFPRRARAILKKDTRRENER